MKYRFAQRSDLPAVSAMYEAAFHPSSDSRQLPASIRELERLVWWYPDAIAAAHDYSVLQGFFMGFPSSKTLAQQFLNGKITEQGLYRRSQRLLDSDAFYLSTCFVKPEQQGKGVARELSQLLLSKPHAKGVQLFGWTSSEAGVALFKSLERTYGPIATLHLPTE